MEAWWGLAAAALALLAWSALTARRPRAPVPGREGYLDRWQALHGGYDPRDSRMVGGWLAVAHAVARPLAAVGIRPSAVTAWNLWLAAVAVALAAESGGWAAAAGLVVVISGLGDAVDGAVAVLTDRTSRWGYVLDSLADRGSDLLYIAAVWVAGAPGWLAAGTAIGLMVLEYVRARANNAGAGEIGAVTVGERASRVIACGATLIAVGVVGVAGAPDRAEQLATVGLAVLAALTVVGLAQLLVAVRRRLGGPADPTT